MAADSNTAPMKTKEGKTVDIRFKCPCGEILTADDKDTNKTAACRRCGRILVVPGIPVAGGVGARYQNHRTLEPEEASETGVSSASPWSDPAVGFPQAAPAAERSAGLNGIAVAALVLGLVGPFLGPLSIVAGVLAIVFGGVALRSTPGSTRTQGRGMAIAGIVLGGVDVLLGVSFILARLNPPGQEDTLDVVCYLLSYFP